jgi:hypothetical protein
MGRQRDLAGRLGVVGAVAAGARGEGLLAHIGLDHPGVDRVDQCQSYYRHGSVSRCSSSFPLGDVCGFLLIQFYDFSVIVSIQALLFIAMRLCRQRFFIEPNRWLRKLNTRESLTTVLGV